MESSHGFWQRRLAVVVGHPPTDYLLARNLYASLTDWRCNRLLGAAPGNAQPYFSAFVALGIGWLLGRTHRPL